MISRPLPFAMGVGITVLLVHGISYFLHEYCHAVVAWLLGGKSNPLALDYGSSSVANLLFQQEVDENVDYGPIFEAHSGIQAALIAGAGPFLGNGITALLCHGIIVKMTRGGANRSSKLALWVLIWFDAFATFNVWSYAPLRTLATHADMATLAKGLDISVWEVFPVAMMVGGWLLWRFCRIALRLAQVGLDPADERGTVGVIILGICFLFYSTGGLDGAYGPYCAILDVISAFVLFPLAVIELGKGQIRHSQDL